MTGLWLAVAAYFLIQLGIGWWASRRIRGEADYLVAGRSLGLVMVAGSLFATWFGAETVMGSATQIAADGLSGGRADPFGYAICLVAMAILIAYRMRAKGYVTLGDFFRDRYGRTTETLAVIILIPTSVIWAAAQLLAFGQVIVVLSDFDLQAALMISLGVVIAYTVLGGLLSDVVTDLFQGAIIVIGLAVLLVFAISAAGGWDAALGQITPDQLSFVGPGESVLGRFDAWAIPIVGSLVAQEAISRFLGARTPAIARNACYVAAAVYLTIGLIPVLVALIGANLGLKLEYDDTFLPNLAAELMPPALFVVFIGALVSAILSTVDSTLLAVAALATRNIIDPLTPKASDRQRLLYARTIVVLAGVVAYVIATGSESIYDLVSTASSYGTAGVAVVTVVGLWSGFGGARAALAALLAGVAGTWIFSAVYDEAAFLLSLALAAAVFVAAGTWERRAVAAQSAVS